MSNGLKSPPIRCSSSAANDATRGVEKLVPAIEQIHSEVERICTTVRKENKKDGTTDIIDDLVKLPRPILSTIMNFLSWLDFHGWYPNALAKEDAGDHHKCRGADEEQTAHRGGALLLHLAFETKIAYGFPYLFFLQPFDDGVARQKSYQHTDNGRKHTRQY